MNQKELIEAIKKEATRYHEAGVSKVVIEAVLSAQAKVVRYTLQADEEIVLPGIGKLTVDTRAARKGRNPATGAAIDIPAKRVPKFSALTALKEAVA